MKKILFSREEMIEETGVDEGTLDEWENLKLVRPDGLTDANIPFYAKDSLTKILKIKQLVDLGYKLDDVQKIVKKVGLPKDSKGATPRNNVHEYLTVGVLAERVGVSPRAIKHWEDKGIIDSDMRSEGGFRLYPESYVYFCQLIKDLQLFGYTLVEIKKISDQFRDYLTIKTNMEVFPVEKTREKLDGMLENIQAFFTKSDLFKQGLERWENLLKKKRKDILALKSQNTKRGKGPTNNA